MRNATALSPLRSALRIAVAACAGSAHRMRANADDDVSGLDARLIGWRSRLHLRHHRTLGAVRQIELTGDIRRQRAQCHTQTTLLLAAVPRTTLSRLLLARKLRHVQVHGLFMTVAHHLQMRLIARRDARHIDREVARVLHLLAVDPAHHVAGLQSGLLRRRVRLHRGHQSAAAVRQPQCLRHGRRNTDCVATPIKPRVT